MLAFFNFNYFVKVRGYPGGIFDSFTYERQLLVVFQESWAS